MTFEEVMLKLEQLGSAQTKKVLVNHGAVEPFFGVKIGDMKPLQKKLQNNQELALQLYESGNGDAMYLAGLIADADKMDKATLRQWAEEASWYMISEYTVPWIAAESKYGFELALEWIKSKDEKIAACGWSCLSSYIAITDNALLDLDRIKQLLEEIPERIKNAPNRVRYCMNGFIIAVGGYVQSLTAEAKNIAKKCGKVEVMVGKTACKVPDAYQYIEKMEQKGVIGKKRKQARC